MTILETERLSVRPWTLDDVDDAFAIYGDPEVTRYLGGGQTHPDEDFTLNWLQNRIATYDPPQKLGFWALIEKASGRVVGGVLLQPAPINGGRPVEVGYHLAQAAWRKGYATEVAASLVRYGFDVVGLNRIYGVVLPGNHASRRVLEKIGMRDQGLGDYAGVPVEVLTIDRPASASRA